MRSQPLKVGLLVAALITVVASVAMAAGLIGGTKAELAVSDKGTPGVSASPPGSTSSTPTASKAVVNVTLTDSGGPRGVGTGELRPGLMGLTLDRATVPHGTVSFRVLNAGVVKHEMLILPLAQSQSAGTRPFGSDAKVDETGSMGEGGAQHEHSTDGGMAPHASHVMTLTLPPGEYELVCNIAGHYVSGMYGKLTVT